jgi:hypothetical protein
MDEAEIPAEHLATDQGLDTASWAIRSAWDEARVSGLGFWFESFVTSSVHADYDHFSQ